MKECGRRRQVSLREELPRERHACCRGHDLRGKWESGVKLEVVGLRPKELGSEKGKRVTDKCKSSGTLFSPFEVCNLNFVKVNQT